MSTCRSCDAEIRWGMTTKGKLMPVDAAPAEDGNVVFTGRMRRTPQGAAPEVQVLTQAGLLGDDRERYMPHHASCPHRENWRRGA